MKFRMKSLLGLLALGCAAALCLVATGVPAQNYPDKPIRLIVPFGAGGGSDYVGRLVGVKLTEKCQKGTDPLRKFNISKS